MGKLYYNKQIFLTISIKLILEYLKSFIYLYNLNILFFFFFYKFEFYPLTRREKCRMKNIIIIVY